MYKFLALLLVMAVGVQAQTTKIQVKRGALANLPTDYNAGEPLWAQDSLDLYVADSINSRNQYIGGRSAQYSKLWYAADAGSNDTYVITLPIVPTLHMDGFKVHFKANTANTGAATLNVNSLGAKSINKNGTDALATGDISAGQIVTVVYDATNDVWQVQGNIGAGQVAGDQFIAIPQFGSWSVDINMAWANSMDDSILVWGFYLDQQVTLTGITVTPGTAGGSGSRDWGAGIYSKAGVLQGRTAAHSNENNANTAEYEALTSALTIGPGFFYAAFVVNLSGSATMQYFAPTVAGNSSHGNQIFVAQDASQPIFGTCAEKATAGVLPASITIESASNFQPAFPFMLILGTNVD